MHFTPIERVLAQRRREIERADRAEAERLYAWLERFYLSGAGERGAAEAARAARADRGEAPLSEPASQRAPPGRMGRRG